MAYGGNPADANNPGVATGDFGVGDFGGYGSGGYGDAFDDMTRARARQSAKSVADAIRDMYADEYDVDRRTGAKWAPDITLQRGKVSPFATDLVNYTWDADTDWSKVKFDDITRRTTPLDLSKVDVDPWADEDKGIYTDTESLNTVAGMLQKAGYNNLGWAGWVPGVRAVTSLLNALNLHDVSPLLTNEENAWDDARWEGSISDPISQWMTPSASDYGAYVDKHSELAKEFGRQKRFDTKEAYGAWHHDKYGQNEGREIPFVTRPDKSRSLAYENAYDMWEGGDQP